MNTILRIDRTFIIKWKINKVYFQQLAAVPNSFGNKLFVWSLLRPTSRFCLNSRSQLRLCWHPGERLGLSLTLCCQSALHHAKRFSQLLLECERDWARREALKHATYLIPVCSKSVLQHVTFTFWTAYVYFGLTHGHQLKKQTWNNT